MLLLYIILFLGIISIRAYSVNECKLKHGLGIPVIKLRIPKSYFLFAWLGYIIDTHIGIFPMKIMIDTRYFFLQRLGNYLIILCRIICILTINRSAFVFVIWLDECILLNAPYRYLRSIAPIIVVCVIGH